MILYSDQHRADAIGYKNEEVRTPNLDGLVRSGTVFSDCYCQYPVCSPSRASFLTGQYAHTHGVLSNNAALHPHAPMFPRLLRERGYSTAAIGKMHFYPTYASYGFDHMELAEQDGPGRFEDDYHRWLANRGALDLTDLVDQRSEFRQYARQEYWDTFGAQASDLPEELHSTTWIGDRAVAYLEHAEPPFCLWVGFIKPHHPFDPPAAWLEPYEEEKLTPLPGWTEKVPAVDAGKRGYFEYEPLTLSKLRRVMAHYYATISHMDAQIGRVLDVLRRRGLEDTVVVYTSDHGEFLGYHHLLLKGDHLYDPLVRVPLTITALGERGWSRGRRTAALVEAVDVTATILAAAGVEPPPPMHGLDLLPVLRGEREHHRDVVFAQNRGMETMMLRTQRSKLVQGVRAEDRMLFDLEADPAETVNLYNDPSLADLQRDLERRLLEHLCGTSRPLSYARMGRQTPRTTLPDADAVADRPALHATASRGPTPYADACRDALRKMKRRGREE